MRALRNNVILELNTVEALGDISVPDKYQKSKDEMRILFVGPGVKDLKVGDIVHKPAMVKAAEKRKVIEDLIIVIDGVDCIPVEEDDIHVVIREAESVVA